MTDNTNMETEKLDIVKLIEKTPIARLNNTYNNKYIEKIKTSFNNSEQQFFLGSFYCYLNHDLEKDYVIELEKVWKWLGFSRIDPCKRVLEKHFVKGIDYKIVCSQEAEKKPITAAQKVDVRKNCKETRTGSNKETILLNIKTFKKLCLKSNTKKADEIHDYFIKLQQMLQDILLEDNKELQQQLEECKRQFQLLQHKPPTHGFNIKKPGFVYLINDLSKPGHYRIGTASNAEDLNTSSSKKLRLCFEIKTYDSESVEDTIHSILLPFNIRDRREWFYFSDNNEVNHAISVMKDVKSFYDKRNFETYDDFANFSDAQPFKN